MMNIHDVKILRFQVPAGWNAAQAYLLVVTRMN